MEETILDAIYQNEVYPEILDDIEFRAFWDHLSQDGSLPDFFDLMVIKHPGLPGLDKKYHNRRCNSALQHLRTDNETQAQSLMKDFLIQRINYGAKYLVIQRMTEPVPITNTIVPTSDALDTSKIFQKVAEAGTQLDGIFSDRWVSNSDNYITVVTHESNLRQIVEAPPEGFLTEEGKRFKDNFSFRRNLLSHSFHKSIISKDGKFRIHLIDENSVLKKAEPIDKAEILNYNIDHSLFEGKVQKLQSFFFFPAVQKLFNAMGVGTVTELAFYTTDKIRYSSKWNGSLCLRKDPFAEGGTRNTGELKVFKIEVMEKSSSLYSANIGLDGTSSMYESPEKNLPWMRVNFGGKTELVKPLVRKVLGFLNE